MTTSRHSARVRPQPVLAGVMCLSLMSLCHCAGPEQSASRSPLRSDQPQATSEPPRDPPPTAKTLYAMGGILAAQGKEAECEFVLRRCVQEHSEFTPAYNSLAELQMRQGRIHEAIHTLTQALKVRPRDPVLLNNLGMCLLLCKEYEPALQHFTDAAGVVPENERYRNNMATALGLLGRHEEALALLQQILPREKAENNAEVLRKAYEHLVQQAPSTPPA
jgi:Flp pilus assembly protein TadD